MRKIAIVGAGQAGLQLGMELLDQGRRVTLYTDRTAQQVFDAPTQPVALQFEPTMQYERDLGLDFWRAYDAIKVDAFLMRIYSPEGVEQVKLRTPIAPRAQAIDLRLKYSRWMREFSRRGGELVIGEADIELLERAAASHDAVFVTAGRKAFAGLFERDAEKSRLDRPHRNLVLLYAKNVAFDPEVPAARHVNAANIIAGAGECLFYPFMYRDTTAAAVVLIEAVPGGPLDIYDRNLSIADNFDAYRAYLRQACPDIHASLADARVLEDELLQGAIEPVVRRPAGRLPSGKLVMALGDALIVHDPVGGQGLNAAAKAADHVARSIAADPAARFDAQWIDRVFAEYWLGAEGCYRMTNDFLTGLQPHQQMAVYAGSGVPAIAAELLNHSRRLDQVYAWFGDPDATHAHLAGRGFAVPRAA
jgi:hypothetical protein